MNDLITNMQKHVSVRQFKDQPLSADMKQQLMTAAQSGSSSNFVQAFSVIEISNKTIKDELAEISNSAPYVKKSGVFYVFVADLYRQSKMLKDAKKSTDGLKNMEELLVASVDTTIAAEDMAVAAESLGLGICYIGGIRNDIRRVAELLHLPRFTFPLFGMTIGFPENKNQVKPRLPKSNQFSVDTYDISSFTDLTDYDQQIHNYYLNRGSNNQSTDWTEKNVDFFKEIRRDDIGSFLKDQVFSLN